MNNIWANRLIGGTKTWEDVPESRKDGVKTVLLERVDNGFITMEQYIDIIGK